MISRAARAVALLVAVAALDGTPAYAGTPTYAGTSAAAEPPAAVDSLNLCAPSTQQHVLISLPTDDAPHAVPIEWYYTTGHLATPSGKRYGFETVLFQGEDRQGSSIIVGQVAVTDLNTGTFHHHTEVASGPFPATKNGFDISLPHRLTMSGSAGVHHILASLPDGYRLNLTLDSLKNPVYQSGTGLIPYLNPTTHAPIGAQYYYSRPLMATVGTLTAPSGTEAVVGEAWFDHEYGRMPLPINWEWFSIQLDDGRDVMAYTIRQFHLHHSPVSHAARLRRVRQHPGSATRLRGAVAGYCRLQHVAPGRLDQSPHRHHLPNQFGLSVPSRGLQLSLTPQLADQEVVSPLGIVPPPYWEGAVTVRGTDHAHPLSGVGYVELVEN